MVNVLLDGTRVAGQGSPCFVIAEAGVNHNGDLRTAKRLIEAAEKAGTLIINKPQSLRDCNEKVFATQFPQCCPPTLVSASAQQIKRFYAEHKDII